jgi:ADP-ribosylglycohydrolase
LAAANLGDDADTTAAITGQIAGAFYGFGGIPSQWVHTLYFREADNPDPSGKIFETFADQLLLLQATLTV